MLHRSFPSNTWYLVSGTIWGGLGDSALLEQEHHWGQALRLNALLFPVCFLCFLLAGGGDASSQLSAAVTIPVRGPSPTDSVSP